MAPVSALLETTLYSGGNGGAGANGGSGGSGGTIFAAPLAGTAPGGGGGGISSKSYFYTGATGASGRVFITWTDAATCTLTTDWDPINKDVGTIMRWTSANATSLSISGIGSVPLSGSANVYPQTTTTFTGTASGTGGTATCTRTVTVAPPATGSITITPGTVNEGSTAMLSWTTTNADEGVYITNVGWVSASGSIQVGSAGTYTLTAYGFGGDNSYGASLAVLASCTLDGVTLQSGQSRTFYAQTSVPQGTMCSSVSQTRTCTNGSLSGSASYQYASCACAVSSSYSCSGQNILRTSIDASCVTTVTDPYTTCVSPSFCSAGSSSCLMPPVTFIQSGDKTGHLQLRPQLVKKGSPAKLFWNVDNVTSCTVSSPDDSWTADTSGPDGQTSRPINQRTTFTLTCTGLDGSTVRETATVGVVPVFQEI